jgi:hypothetical protein
MDRFKIALSAEWDKLSPVQQQYMAIAYSFGYSEGLLDTLNKNIENFKLANEGQFSTGASCVKPYRTKEAA